MLNFVVANWWLFSALFYMSLIALVRMEYSYRGYVEQPVGPILIWGVLGLAGPFSLLALGFGGLCILIEEKGGRWINNLLDKEIEIVSKKKRLKDELDNALYGDEDNEQGY